MGRWRGILLAGLVLAPVLTQAAPRDAAVEALPEIASGIVRSVEDGATLTLTDGQRLRLAGLLVPEAPLALGRDAVWPAAETARQALSDRVLGRSVSLHAAQDKPDRHGRLVGQAMLPDGTWLQQDLLHQGFDRLEATRDTAALAPALLKAEADARRHRRGLWRLAIYAVRAPDRLSARDTGGFVLVEGRVLAVAAAHEATYLDFAEDWHHGFTIRIPRAVLQRGQGFDPAALEGHKVRVRGWLAYDGRPILDLADLTALELLPAARKSTKRP